MYQTQTRDGNETGDEIDTLKRQVQRTPATEYTEGTAKLAT